MQYREIYDRLFALLPSGSREADRDDMYYHNTPTTMYARICLTDDGAFPTAADLDLDELGPVVVDIEKSRQYGDRGWYIWVYGKPPTFADGTKYNRPLPIVWPHGPCRCHKCPHRSLDAPTEPPEN